MKTLLIAIVSAVAVSVAQGQGYFNFDNIAASGTITLAPGHGGEGNGGDYPGSTYDAALYYSLTPITGYVDPSTLTFAAGSTTAFYGTTGSAANGHSPIGDGAGLFDAGAVTIPGTADGQTIYVEAAVWYAASGAASLAAAEAGGLNYGWSSAIPVRLASGTDNTIGDMSAMPSLVFPVPEPGTIALGALGGATLLLLHRQKKAGIFTKSRRPSNTSG